ncbi:PQQ-binding-like beta-propeller repeat protein [Frankia sp. Cr2]|uniref:outer membrane protein assembly factor BamB family protein n=1 Tax=Frankia sp. Cr2 TaxID=3073932 RepID=UPI002AD2B03C|nr:PQQ-binding-like beta-propeller repeat protein [Frankia sp. Cr2]
MSPGPSSARLRTIDLATGKTLTELSSSSPSADGNECDIRVVRRFDDVSLLISTRVKSTPAQGIDPGSTEISLRARDATTGRRLWDSPLLTVPEADGGPLFCYSLDIDKGTVDRLKFTSDGRYALSLRSAIPLVVDLATGESRQLAKAVNTLSRWILTAIRDDDRVVRQMGLVDPGTLVEAGRISDEVPVMYLDGGIDADTGILGDIMVSNGRNTNADPGFPDLIGYRLPSFTTLWSIAQKAAPQGLGLRFDDAAQAGLFIAVSPGVSGLDPATGAIRWQLPAIEDYCGTANGRVYVIANGQFATIDPKTGKQLTFDPKIKKCPVLLDGAIITAHRDSDVSSPYYLIQKQ